MTKFCRDKQIQKTEIILKNIQVFREWKKSQNLEQAVKLLTKMQQEVVVIGTVLETEKKDYHLVVAELERLCEILYQISITLENGQQVRSLGLEAEKIIKNLRKCLRAVMPRKEIVFLPYQVSMWDSLESVWLEAAKDKTVDTYVIPIPYYDVLPDGSLGILHDQRADYPADVPIAQYEDYLMEERHPDVVFFHNPYDGCNSVTRVPEQYYASRLKKCAGQLVYIPYFVSEEGGPSEHFCYLPGVLFADKVVVQPGCIYERYCQIYTRTLEENGWGGILAPAEQKFLPLDSPKFDKVLNTRCEIKDLPEDWQTVIQRPDGSRKKIVLYDLTILNLLNNNEQILKKVENVFRLYREKQEDVVLLWRPHPLLLSTIDSMRPQLRDAYLSLVQQLQQEGWGIFDHTPDPNLAMALADAYYGDCSSLLTTFRVTGKPMKMQDVWLEDEQEFLAEVLNDSNRPQENTVSSRENKQIGSMIYHTVMSGKQ